MAWSELFDIVVESCLLGERKPSARIFMTACQRLGVNPRQCVFLDDITANSDARHAYYQGKTFSNPIMKKLSF